MFSPIPSVSPASPPTLIPTPANDAFLASERHRADEQWESMVRLQAGGTYVIAIGSEDDTQIACCQILGGMSSRKEAWLVTVNQEPAEAVAGLRALEGPKLLRLYRLDVAPRRSFKSLVRLPEFVTRKLRPMHGMVVVCLPAATLLECSETALKIWLERCNDALRSCGSGMLLIVHGPEASTLEIRLRPLNHYLSGLARLQRENEFAYYQIRHWRSDEGVTAARQLALIIDAEHRFQTVLRSSALRPHEYLDADTHLAMATTVEQNWRLPGSLELFADIKALYQRAMQARAATVIFAIDDHSQLEALAHIAHRLRTERGDALSLVVRELTPCVRYRDEHVLHACGVNLVVPHSMTSSRFLSLLGNMRGHWASRPVVNEPGKLFALPQLPGLQGRYDLSQFIRYTRLLLDLDTPGPGKGVLVVQRPVPGIRTDQAFSQYRLSRQGDLAAVLDDRIVLFLYGINPDTLNSTLEHLCRLPPELLFAESQSYTMEDDIRTQLFLLLAVAEAAAPAMPGARAFLPRRFSSTAALRRKLVAE